MSKLFKIFLSCFLAVLVFCLLCFFQNLIVKKYHYVSVLSSLPEKTEVRLIIPDSDTLLSKRVNKQGVADFSIPDLDTFKFKIEVKNKKLLNRIDRIVVNDKTIYQISNPKENFVFNVDIPPQKIYFYHRLIIPVLCLIWLVWGVFYKQNHLTKNTQSRLLPLDFLRVLFTFIILFRHLFNSLSIRNSCWIGVEIFFLLSGFFMFLSYNKNFSVLQFIKKEFIRFTPLMIFTALLSSVFLSSFSFSVFFDTVLYLGRSIMDVQIYNSVCWYIGVLFWTLLFYNVLLQSVPQKFANFIMGVIVFFSYMMAVKYDFHHTFKNGYPIPLFRGLAGCGLGYFIGVVFSKIEVSENTKTAFKYTLLEFFLFFGLMSCLFVKGWKASIGLSWILGWAVLILLFVLKRGSFSRFFDKKIWGILGQYTLSFYLIHYLLSSQLLRALKKEYSLQGWNNFTISAVVILGCIVASVISHHFIEKPTKDFLIRKISK